MADARRVRLVAGYALAAAAIVFVARYIGVNGGDFMAALRGLSPAQWALSALGFVACSVINAAAFASLHAPHRNGKAFVGMVWLAALPAKYVPIGVGHVVGRGALLAADGADVRDVVRSGIQEQVLSIVLCATIAGLALMAMRTSIGSGWLVASGVLVVLACIAGVASTLQGAGRTRRASIAVGLYALAMAAFAAGYGVLAAPADVAPFLAGLFGGTLAGIAVVVAPGGLGVREAVAGAFASDPAQVLGAFAAARALILATELALSAMAAAWIARARRRIA